MFTYISLSGIIRDHWRTLYIFDLDGEPLGIDKAAILVLYGVPLGFGLMLGYVNFSLSNEGQTALMTAMTIFAGLLLNLLAIAYSMIGAAERAENPKTILQIIRVTCAKISYSIVIALAAILILVVLTFSPISKVPIDEESVARQVCYGALSFFVAHFFFILCTVLKQMHTLIDNEIRVRLTPPPN